MRIIKTILSVVLCLGVVFSTAALNAQTQSAERLPEVNKVRILFEGFQSASEEYVLGNIQLRPGMDYNPTVVDQSIRALYATNQFEFVEVKVEDAGGDKVDVVFQVVPKYTIGSLQFNGNNEYSESRLASKGEIVANVPLDEYGVSLAAEKIEAYYVEKGYPDVSVEYRINRDAETGYATVIFDIDEGGKVKITDIEFSGNDSYKDKKLRKVLAETKESSWLSWITGSGKFDEVKFKEDLELLRVFYRNNGYLDVVINEDDVDLSFKTEKKLRITVAVTEGQRYHLGKLSVENNTIFTSDELMRVVRLRPDEPFSPEGVDETATTLTEYYTARGYLNAYVRAERVPNMESRRIDVVFRVRESEKFYVESINVEGNTKTKSRVIIRELALRPGDVFDMTRMKTSESRLKNTRYFEEDVRLSPESTNVPGRKDLNVTVGEGRTGNFSFGAGFGSVESAVIYFELTQGNFDLFNWRNGFQGDGQKFRFRASLGTNSNEVVITFEEPWLFEQRLAFGVELFRRESDYNSSDYNELRTGFELYLRRRLFELVEARLSYRLELVEIFDVGSFPDPDLNGSDINPDGSVADDGIPDVFQAAEGESVVSKVGLTFLRDTRDAIVFTRKGNRTSILNEFAGLGGDVFYYKLDGRTAHFIPTWDTLEQSISIVGRLGTVVPYGDSEIVPFYDRFYLGGPESLRGFEHRDIGPRDDDDNNESVGGNTYGLLSFEYMFRVAEPLGLVVFYDWGFVNEDEYDFNISNAADNWGVGARIIMMGSPLKLDLGFPITDPYGDAEGMQFNFSFGTRF